MNSGKKCLCLKSFRCQPWQGAVLVPEPNLEPAKLSYSKVAYLLCYYCQYQNLNNTIANAVLVWEPCFQVKLVLESAPGCLVRKRYERVNHTSNHKDVGKILTKLLESLNLKPILYRYFCLCAHKRDLYQGKILS